MDALSPPPSLIARAEQLARVPARKFIATSGYGKDGDMITHGRGSCPECGNTLVSTTYEANPLGFIIVLECVASLSPSGECDYRRVL